MKIGLLYDRIRSVTILSILFILSKVSNLTLSIYSPPKKLSQSAPGGKKRTVGFLECFPKDVGNVKVIKNLCLVHKANQHDHRSCGIARSRIVKHRYTPLDLAIQREREQIVKVFWSFVNHARTCIFDKSQTGSGRSFREGLS